MIDQMKADMLAEFPAFAEAEAEAETREERGTGIVELKIEGAALQCLHLDSNGYLLELIQGDVAIAKSGFCPSIEVAAFSLRLNAGKYRDAIAEVVERKQAHLRVLGLVA